MHQQITETLYSDTPTQLSQAQPNHNVVHSSNRSIQVLFMVLRSTCHLKTNINSTVLYFCTPWKVSCSASMRHQLLRSQMEETSYKWISTNCILFSIPQTIHLPLHSVPQRSSVLVNNSNITSCDIISKEDSLKTRLPWNLKLIIMSLIFFHFRPHLNNIDSQ